MDFKIVVAGTSLGGLKAITALLSALPENFSLPLVVIQHREYASGELLKGLLQKVTCLPVQEVEDKDAILPGRIYLAPPDYHLLIDRGEFALSIDDPVTFARPSVDVAFDSAAASYGQGVLAVILTGAGRDGAAGAASIEAFGGVVLVQDPSSAEAKSMPQAAIAATKAAHVLPLAEIISFLHQNCCLGGQPQHV